MLPIGFKEGGWMFSPIPLMVMCLVEGIGAIKLVQAANKLKVYEYPDIVEYAFGKTALRLF